MTQRLESSDRLFATRARARLGTLATMILVCGLAVSAAGQTETVVPMIDSSNRDYDQMHLDLDLRLDLEAGKVAGTATHRIASLVESLQLVRMHAVDLTVSEVRVEGAPLEFAAADGMLSFSLVSPLSRGQQATIQVDYEATPTRGLYFFRPTEKHPTIPYQVWSQGEGRDNRHWFPCYDLPDDRLASDLTVTVPARFVTLSNGALVDVTEVEDGKRRHHWKLERPHVSYLVTLVVGEFEEVVDSGGGVEIRHLVPPGWKDSVEECLGRTRDMMAFFVEYTGVSFAWPLYHQVTVWDFMFGGMENTGATTLNMRALHRDGVRPDYSADGLIAHELVHQWYGDLITCRTFDHIWLNEGFATYFTDLWFERSEGSDAFLARRQKSKRRYTSAVDPHVAAATPRRGRWGDCGDVRQHPYVKGSSVLHMLRELLGDEVFRRALASYTQELSDLSVESEQLRAILERESGADLGWFFRQWVYGSGYPELSLRHSFQAAPDDAGGVLTLSVAQTQVTTPDMPLFRMPTRVIAYGPAGQKVERIFEVSREREEWRIDLDWRPSFVRFDPDGALIADLNEQAPIEEWRAQLARDPSIIGRLLAAEALAGFGTEAIQALATAAASDPRFEVRQAALDSLSRIDGAQASAAIVQASTDVDSRVRQSAYVAMGGRPAADVSEALHRALDLESQDYPLAEAVHALGKCNAEGARERIIATLKRSSHRDIVRTRALDALALLGDVRDVDHALTYLSYRFGQGVQHRLRHSALDAAVTLGLEDTRVRARVLELCEDPYFRMRSWAIGQAETLNLTEAIPVLAKLAKEDDAPGVRGAAERALKSLQAPQTPPGATTEAAESDPPDEELTRMRQEIDRAEKELEILKARASLREAELLLDR